MFSEDRIPIAAPPPTIRRRPHVRQRGLILRPIPNPIHPSLPLGREADLPLVLSHDFSSICRLLSRLISSRVAYFLNVFSTVLKNIGGSWLPKISETLKEKRKKKKKNRETLQYNGLYQVFIRISFKTFSGGRRSKFSTRTVKIEKLKSQERIVVAEYCFHWYLLHKQRTV